MTSELDLRVVNFPGLLHEQPRLRMFNPLGIHCFNSVPTPIRQLKWFMTCVCSSRRRKNKEDNGLSDWTSKEARCIINLPLRTRTGPYFTTLWVTERNSLLSVPAFLRRPDFVREIFRPSFYLLTLRRRRCMLMRNFHLTVQWPFIKLNVDAPTWRRSSSSLCPALSSFVREWGKIDLTLSRRISSDKAEFGGIRHFVSKSPKFNDSARTVKIFF